MKIRGIFFRYWPFLYIFFVWFLFSSPYFVQGLVPYPSKYQVTFFAPWNAVETWRGPVKNNAMPDVIDQLYPWKYFTVYWMKQWQIPLWNPYNFAGNPHIGNYQSAVFSPFNLLFFPLPFVDAWSILVLLQPLLAGVFTYFFLRSLSVSKIASVLGSISFMFCGFIVVWMAYTTLAMAIVFLPLALFAIEKYYSSSKIAYVFLLSMSIFISFVSGHFQTSVYFVSVVMAYIIYKIFNTKNYILAKPILLAFTAGILLSLIQIIPTLRLYETSVRSNLNHYGGGIPWQYLITAIAPDFYGNPVTRNDWFGTYAEWSSFVGVIPLFFALFAVKNNYKSAKFFFFTGLIALLFAMESPLHSLLLATHIPVFATSIPSRLIVIFSFCVAVLSAIGFDAFIISKKKDVFKKNIPVFLAVVSILLLFLVLAKFSDFIPADKKNISFKNMILPIMLFFLTTITIFIQTKKQGKNMTVILSFLLLLAASFDNLRFASKWMPFDAKDLVFPTIPVIQAIEKEKKYDRVFGNLGTQVESYYGFQSLEGYDPLYISRYGEFIQYANTGTFTQPERSVVHIDRNGLHTKKLLDFLGVRLIFHPKADSFQSWAFPVWAEGDRYKKIYEDEKFNLYENTTALPRASLFYAYEITPDNNKILKRFYSSDFDFKKTLLLEENIGRLIEGTGSAKIVLHTPNKVIITTQSTHPAVLFLSDVYYDGWNVFVNNAQQKLLRADYAFRGVKVPQGKSEVIFEYKKLLW